MKQNIKKIFMPQKIFIIVASIFGVVSAFLQPILDKKSNYLPDEGFHFFSSFDLFAKNQIFPFAPLDNTNLSIMQKPGFSLFGEYGLLAKGWHIDIGHLPQGVGILLARIFTENYSIWYYTGRIFNLFVYILITFFVIKKVKYGKWGFVIIALLPMAIQQVASFSYDGLVFTFFFCIVGYFINLSVQANKIKVKQVVKLCILIIFGSLVKPNIALCILLFLFLPKRVIYDFKAFKYIYKKIKRPIFILASSLISILIIIIACFKFISYIHNYCSVTFLIKVIFRSLFSQNTLLVINGIFGNFGNVTYFLPMQLSEFLAIILLFVMLAKTYIKKGEFKEIEQTKQMYYYPSKVFGLACICLFVVNLLGISLTMYFTWTLPGLGANYPYIEGFQGRYITVLLPFFIPFFASIQEVVGIKVKENTIKWIVIFSVLLGLIYYVKLTIDFY